TGAILQRATAASAGRREAAAGRSEWDTGQLLHCAAGCLRELTDLLGPQAADVAAIGVTGQQHGSVVVDTDGRPLTPFINWQDQRGNEASGETGATWVDLARKRIGPEATVRTGCRLNSGFLATTLFWMRHNDSLPNGGRACFLADLFVAGMTATEPVSEPTMAGSAGVFDVTSRRWDTDAITALGLSPDLFPPIREAEATAGALNSAAAEQTGLRVGIPVAPAIGDHQASFLGSVADRSSTVLLNIGTGAQVAVFTAGVDFAAPIELRPFPIRGNLLSNVGLAGGWSFQLVEHLIRQIGQEVFGVETKAPLYDRLTELAAQADEDCGGVTCVPTFTGTRSAPGQRGSFAGLSPRNLSPANLFRSVLEGMATNYRTAWDQIAAVTGTRQTRLVGAGNGLRENRVLADAVLTAFGLTPCVTQHREEAAFGAALIGAVAAGVFESLDQAGSLIQYE
ncbi:MAG: sedoheptulokinase, partial [Planctomycetota bacterium]